MNTIEERARKAASRCIEWFFDKNKEDVDGVTHTIQYALTEQKQIDLNKVCEWLRKQTSQEYPGAPHLRIFDDYDINEFRKEMEKE